MLAATLLGVLGTVVTGNEPGFLLGFLVFIGSVIATLGVRRSALYVVFPLPALANFIGAVAAGAIHDRGIDTSTTELGASFLQWIANVFFAMCATTIIVLVIAGARWLLARQLVSGQFAMSADRRPDGSGPRPASASGRRPDRGQRPGDRDPWAAVDPWGDRAGTGGQRPARDQRDSRDPWGDRRRPADRSQPGTGPQPGGANPPGGRSQPGGTSAPGNRTPGGGTAPGGTFPPAPAIKAAAIKAAATADSRRTVTHADRGMRGTIRILATPEAGAPPGTSATRVIRGASAKAYAAFMITKNLRTNSAIFLRDKRR